MYTREVRSLYKAILRLHRSLPKDLRDLGDAYLRDEFRRHKNSDKLQIEKFQIEWMEYYSTLAGQVRQRILNQEKALGNSLSENELDGFAGEQIHQLYELKTTIQPNVIEQASESIQSGSKL